MTLRRFVQTILPELSTAVHKTTYRKYLDDMEAFHTWLGQDVDLDEISPQTIKRFHDVNPTAAGSVRVIMAHHDPIAFRRLRRPAQSTDNAQLSNPSSEVLNAHTLSAVYFTRYEPLALRSRRPNTKRLYRTTLVMFDKFLGHRATLDDLCDETVARFASWRLENNLSKHSVNKDLANILALLALVPPKRISATMARRRAGSAAATAAGGLD